MEEEGNISYFKQRTHRFIYSDIYVDVLVVDTNLAKVSQIV